MLIQLNSKMEKIFKLYIVISIFGLTGKYWVSNVTLICCFKIFKCNIATLFKSFFPDYVTFCLKISTACVHHAFSRQRTMDTCTWTSMEFQPVV